MQRWIIAAFCLPILGCGVSYKAEYVKQYNVHVESKDPEMVDVISNLTSAFNEESGHDGIRIVDDSSQANSTIRFVPELLREKQYLGYGVGLTREVEGEKTFKGLTKIEDERLVLYSMHLQFDEANFKKHAEAVMNTSDNGESWEHLYHLFCHEVGHGMLLEHDESSASSVMYPVIHKLKRDQIDYQGFFSRIDSFFKEGR